MTSIRAKFRASTAREGEGDIYYQIVHDRKSRTVNTNYRIRISEWDERRGVLTTDARTPAREQMIRLLRENMRRDMDRLKKIIHRMEGDGLRFTVDEVVKEYTRCTTEHTLFKFMAAIIAKLKRNGKLRTSETYTSALNSFKTFHDNEDIMLDNITSELMESYEAWHKSRGNSSNTISFYTRILRAVYNRAVEENIIENRNPFRHVYTGVDKTVKRALPLMTIKRIKSLDLSESPKLEFARDMFILSFMLRGMSFIDMAYLRKSDLRRGHVIYRRRKTGQQLIIEWTKDMQRILNKYPENRTQYLLPIITNPEADARNTYRNMGYKINHNLKMVGELSGLNIPLTLYVARHSWASAAKTKGIPVSVISEGMGHDSESTTRIYLVSLDTAAVDRANARILKCL